MKVFKLIVDHALGRCEYCETKRKARSTNLSELVTTLNTDMERVSGAVSLLPGEYYKRSKYSSSPNMSLDHFLGRDCCEYCRSNPGKSETCKNCGAPTAFDAEYQKAMLTPPIIYNPLRIDASKISNKPRDLIPIRS